MHTLGYTLANIRQQQQNSDGLAMVQPSMALPAGNFCLPKQRILAA